MNCGIKKYLTFTLLKGLLPCGNFLNPGQEEDWLSIMTENNIQTQIDDINRKLDFVLLNVNEQRLKRVMVEDLVADLSIVGIDLFRNAVYELDNQGIELDVDQLKIMFFKLIKNIGNSIRYLRCSKA